ncbi:MAG: Cu(I)/Ag(I) efflux system membrane fusion protein [Salibacteraceae bacterium]|jgi:Cu(I)/Ag(I) efflux system membrane fusion protein
MKKQFLLLFLFFSLLSVSQYSCREDKPKGITEHYCPMKCEGEKTYKTEESCPVCGMDLLTKK